MVIKAQRTLLENIERDQRTLRENIERERERERERAVESTLSTCDML